MTGWTTTQMTWAVREGARRPLNRQGVPNGSKHEAEP
jgi:hypothetical protein